MVMSSFRRSSLVAVLAILAACEGPTKPPVPVASVVVGPGVALVDAGGTVQYGVIVSDANGNRLEGRAVTWSIADTAIATISATGLVTAKANPSNNDRSTTVRATVSDKIGQSTVSVRPSVVTQLQIVPLIGTLDDGEAPTLTAQARDASGTLLPGRTVTWQTRDVNTARITQAGVLTPVAFIGAENRTVRIVANVGQVYDSITVTVTPTQLSEVRMYPRRPFVQPGWSKTLRIEGRTPAGSAVSGLTPTFTSSDPAIATVNANGVVVAQPGAAGDANIISTFGSFSDTVRVTVDNCGASTAGTFPLEVRFYGANPPSPSVEAAFTCAANRIRAIIREPIATTAFNNTNLQGCLGEALSINEATSGLIIYAKVDSIDGPGAVLGSAGPCFVRTTSRLPALGVMRFDRFDLDALEVQGRLGAVIMHEMLHVIGIGTTWRDANFNPPMWTGAVTNPGFLGLRARESCVNDHGGANICQTQVPIEDCVGITGCGAGTIHGHWRELIFRTELMTGYVSAVGVQNPLSRMTIQALGDLGYSVDPDQSNDYVIPPQALMGLMEQGGRGRELALPAPLLPKYEIDPMGRWKPIVR